LAQVLGNLLDNALRHTPAGSRVRLSCRRSNQWIEILVVDTGDGVAAEHLPHLFDRFYRADAGRDRTHGGSGIGLSIAKALVEAHGGTIFATSAGLGHGTTFTVRLPASA
jgi:signal transduction histidine kinase